MKGKRGHLLQKNTITSEITTIHNISTQEFLFYSLRRRRRWWWWRTT
jgi:hypothetical protein